MNEIKPKFSETIEQIAVDTKIIDGKRMMRLVPFKAGMIVQRCGRRYQIDEKGIQRRVK